MAIVRCPKHKIPYNDENPRGCPACALESTSTEEFRVMRELAKASGTKESEPRATKQTPREPAPSGPPPRQTLSDLFQGRPPQVTTRPVKEDRVAAILRALRTSRLLQIGLPAILLMAGWLYLSSGSQFVPDMSPGLPTGQVLPLPIEPGMSMANVFSALGTQPPAPHPTNRRLARYSYGTGLTIEGFNGSVYSIQYELTNRAWQGVRVGLGETEAQGRMASIAPPQRTASTPGGASQVRSGYVTYQSENDIPSRTYLSQIRPPNGCYDLEVLTRPRIIGYVIQGEDRYPAVAREDGDPGWVSARVTVTSRSRATANPAQGC